MNILLKRTAFLSLLLLTLTLTHAQAPEQEDKASQDRKYVKVAVDGLACPFCAYGLEKKLTNIEGQDDLHINIDEGFATFSVPVSSTISKDRLRSIVKNAGFTAREITFAQDPFENTQRTDE